MAPVIQTTPKDRERPSKRPADKRSELICRVNFKNTLPDIPFDPKFITYPFESNRFVQYKPTSLEKNYKHDILTEHDLGVTIDLINPDTYFVVENHAGTDLPLAAEDTKLLDEEPAVPQNTQRSRHHNKVVPWLKKTEYISTEFNRYGASSEKTETKVGYNVKKAFKEETLYIDRESQINKINKTFLDAQKPILKHHSEHKQHVTPVEILPVFPDFELWKYPFAQVQFDAEPAAFTQMEEMSQAMIRGVQDLTGEQFVAYFLPTQETLKKRKRDEEDGVEYLDSEEYEYSMAREYNWNVKNKASKGYEESYFFLFKNDGVYYNELETRVRLSKRRNKLGTHNNSKLIIKHRPLNEGEFKIQDIRMCQLEQPQEEEEPQQEPSLMETVEENITKLTSKDSTNANDGVDEEDEDFKLKKPRKVEPKSSGESSSGESSSGSSSSGSSGSEDEEEVENTSKNKKTDEESERRMKAKRDEEEIFGSASDDD